MSEIEFVKSQRVRVIKAHNHIEASNEVMYTIKSIDRIQGLHFAMLENNEGVVGAVPLNNLK